MTSVYVSNLRTVCVRAWWCYHRICWRTMVGMTTVLWYNDIRYNSASHRRSTVRADVRVRRGICKMRWNISFVFHQRIIDRWKPSITDVEIQNVRWVRSDDRGDVCAAQMRTRDVHSVTNNLTRKYSAARWRIASFEITNWKTTWKLLNFILIIWNTPLVSGKNGLPKIFLWVL